ncbi:hypothetical protein DAPPUDRAFT_254142 [Daphnia pulex]|uniref:RING-type domain-containing protein n=1 Tax=Daphnia pulex TaxID=6669 RepID=E9H6D7_DAPPU|nr:hypothetical protein DAPPUDRAFT_254142 [Daphnia pulex]|eukprot:EFX72715.1 hypothetical protein DAPPUDRAFT_254142 [Daphnia pulex]
MIEQNSFTLLVTKIFTWIISAVFWHGMCYLEFSWTGIIACVACVWSSLTICLTFIVIPASRPDIRWIFSAFSWAYLGYWATTFLVAGLSSLFQALKAWQIIDGAVILQLLTSIISNKLHLYLGLVSIIYLCLTIKNYYTTRRNPAANVSRNEDDFEDEEEQNRFLAKFANIANDGECPICMGPHNNATKPFCGHVFCCRCLITWICVSSATCPVCRSQVTYVIYDRPPSADDLIPAAAPRLFNFNVDEDLLERQLLEMHNSVMAYGLRLCSTVVFCLAWVDITTWICSYTIN